MTLSQRKQRSKELYNSTYAMEVGVTICGKSGSSWGTLTHVQSGKGLRATRYVGFCLELDDKQGCPGPTRDPSDLDTRPALRLLGGNDPARSTQTFVTIKVNWDRLYVQRGVPGINSIHLPYGMRGIPSCFSFSKLCGFRTREAEMDGYNLLLIQHPSLAIIV